MSIVSSLGPAVKDVEPELARARSGRTIHAIKEGWMYKKGSTAFTAFKRRYMILWTNKRIEYYTSDELSTMKGAVNLLGLQKRAIQRSDKVPKKQEMFGFQIATESRTWYFAVKTENEREDWIKTIRAVVYITSPISSPRQSPQPQQFPPSNLPKPPPKNLKTLAIEKEKEKEEEKAEEKEVGSDSDYDPGEILEGLQRQYDAKHNPHRIGKKAQGIQWSDEDSLQDSLTDESDDNINAVQVQQQHDDDIDVAYNWNAAMDKIKEKTDKKYKESIHLDSMDGLLDSDDSLNESEEESVAAYQKHVYDNEQPMMNIDKKRREKQESQVSLHRARIDWDEDEFDSDSLSDETEESDEEKVTKNRYNKIRSPSTKSENHFYIHPEKKSQKEMMNEVSFINAGYIVLKLYYPLMQYIQYKTDEKGKGILIKNVQRNKYGKKLYITYGFSTEENWYIESIDDENITDKLLRNIEGMLRFVDLDKGYKVVFKKPVKKKKVNSKTKKIGKSVYLKKKSTKRNTGKSAKSAKSPKTKSSHVNDIKTSKNVRTKSPKNTKVKSPKSNNAKSPKNNNAKSPKNNNAKSPKNGKKSGKESKIKKTKIK